MVGVLYKVPLIYLIGESGMGYFNTAYSVYGIFYVISCAGIPKAVTVLVAGNSELASDEYVMAVCKRLFKAFAAIGVAVTGMFILLAGPILELIGNSKAIMTMLAIAPSIFFVTVSGVLKGYLNGKSRFAVIALSQLIEALSKLVLGLGFVLLGRKLNLPLHILSAFGVTGIMLGSVFSAIYMYIKCFGYKANVIPRQKMSVDISKHLKEILRVAIPITASSAVLSLSSVVDISIVIRGLCARGYTEEQANIIYGNYSTLAIPMIGLVGAVLTPVSVALLPRLVSKKGARDFSDALNGAWLLTCVLAIPAALVYGMYSFDILELIFGSGTSAKGADALSSIACAALILPLLSLVNTALEAKGWVLVALASLSAGVAVKTAVATALISMSDIGVSAAAVGTVVSYAFSLLFSMIALGAYGPDIRALRHTLLLILLAVSSYAPFYFYVYSVNLFSNHLASLLVSLAVPSAVYLGAVVICVRVRGGTPYGNILHKKQGHIFDIGS